MNRFILNLLILIVAISSGCAAQAITKPINLTNKDLVIIGGQYSERTGEQIDFYRFPKTMLGQSVDTLNFNPAKATSSGGITLLFATNSDKISLTFEVFHGLNRGSEFALYEDGMLVQTFEFAKAAKQMQIEFQKRSDTDISLFELVLPSLANPSLTAFNIDQQSQLYPIEQSRKTYLAIGDSITHGVGQGRAAYKTYPFILSRAIDHKLINLAVGGARVSVPMLEVVKDIEHVDLVTILFGYNDWNTKNADPDAYANQYRQLILGIRESHPDARIFAITPLYTKRTKAKHSDLPLDAYRQQVRNIVSTLQDAGDSNLHLIEGESVSSAKNLRKDNTDDPVHLGVEGAWLLAKALLPIIQAPTAE